MVFILKADNHDISTFLTELHVFQTSCMHMDSASRVGPLVQPSATLHAELSYMYIVF